MHAMDSPVRRGLWLESVREDVVKTLGLVYLTVSASATAVCLI